MEENRIVSLFERRHVCFLILSLPLPASFPFWNWVRPAIFPVRSWHRSPAAVQKSKWTANGAHGVNGSDLTWGIHSRSAETIPCCKGNLVPLGKSPRKWAELDNGIVSLLLPLVALLFSVFTIYFLRWIFSNAIMNSDGKNRLSSCWLFEITEGRFGIWTCSIQLVLQALMMTTYKIMGQRQKLSTLHASKSSLANVRCGGFLKDLIYLEILFYKTLW